MNDDFISSLLNSSYDISLSNVKALKDEYDAAAKAYNDYYEAFKDKIDDSVAGKQIEETLKQLQTAMNQAEENMLAGLESALQAAQALLDDSLEKAKRSFQQATATDDWSMTLFERQKEMDDMYLDDYEKIYEFSKLTRDVNNSINNTQTIRDRERLLEVTEEIAQLEREGAEVSQYQVDALRAKYELRLAEIALEDAQNAKSTVRMQRDNEGNWSYVYTAEQNKVDEARQN
jgi:thioesterase domain-containing protein